jgi:hypothetical protein
MISSVSGPGSLTVPDPDGAGGGASPTPAQSPRLKGSRCSLSDRSTSVSHQGRRSLVRTSERGTDPRFVAALPQPLWTRQSSGTAKDASTRLATCVQSTALLCQAHRSPSLANALDVRPRQRLRRTSTLGRHEEKPRPFLIVMPSGAALRIVGMLCFSGHPRTVALPVSSLFGNLT